MKAHYKSPNGRMVFEVEGETPKNLFRSIAELQELFETEESCGVCNSLNIRLSHRVIDNNEYFGLRCACGAEFSFGQKRQGGGLFPKRNDAEGNALPHRGWKIYLKIPPPER